MPKHSRVGFMERLKTRRTCGALQFELSVATHFTRRGLHVQWPEMTGVGTFDLLVDGLDTQPLEVECSRFRTTKGEECTVARH